MFRTAITPRVNETDGAGHINNTIAPQWFEAGRLEIFRILTPDLDFARWRAALVNVNIDYTAQIYFGHDCLVETWIERIGSKSFTVGERILQRGEVCAEGTATYVYFVYETNESAVIPEDIRAALAAHQGKPDDP